MNRLDPVFVRMQIEALRVSHPDIWDADDEKLLADMLEGETGLHEFLAAAIDRMLDADAKADGIQLLIDEWKARSARFVQRSDALRALAFKLMQQAGVRKIELVPATLSIRTGTPKVIVTDEAALPPACIRIKREPDKIAIRDHLARGEQVPGAELSNSEPQLAVRIK